MNVMVKRLISNLKSYPKTKDSGVQWLGKVPEHWNLQRTKTLLRERVEKGFPDEPLLAATQTKGVVLKERYENRTVLALKDLHLLKLVRVGDFVISLRSFQGGIEYAREQGIISPAYTILYPEKPEIHAYLARLFKSRPYVENLVLYVTGIRQGQNIDYAKLSCSELPIPPLSDQAAIVRYLDYMDRRIRRYIRAKQKLIKLLEEQKQAIIDHAVTHGLDPNVRLKSSGVEWLGDVPEHWRAAIKLKYISVLKGRLGWQGLKASEYTSQGPYIVSSAHFKDHKVDWDICPHVMQERYQMDVNIQLSEDDILLMKDGAAMGKLAFIDFLPDLACLNSHLLIFRPLEVSGNKTYNPRFMFYFMTTNLFQNYIQVNGTGATFLGISQEALGNFKICLPPDNEQGAIAEFLDNETALLNKARTRIETQIDFFRKYRTRLIADIVTGKLDVREAVKHLPAEINEPESLDEPDISSEGEEMADNLDAIPEEAA